MVPLSRGRSSLRESRSQWKQAPLYTVAILLSAELTLMRLSAPAGLRFACFMLLIMIWGCLRL